MTLEVFLSVYLPLVIPVVVFLVQFVLLRTPDKIHNQLLAIAHVTVGAVEQTHQNSSGAAKKAAALGLITQVLKDAHLHVNPALVDASIEYAVGFMNSFGPATPPIPPTPIVPPAVLQPHPVAFSAL